MARAFWCFLASENIRKPGFFVKVPWARSGLQHFAKHLGEEQGDSYRVVLRNKSCQTNLISFPDRVTALEVRKKQKMPTKALWKAFSTVSPAVLRRKASRRASPGLCRISAPDVVPCHDSRDASSSNVLLRNVIAGRALPSSLVLSCIVNSLVKYPSPAWKRTLFFSGAIKLVLFLGLVARTVHRVWCSLL